MKTCKNCGLTKSLEDFYKSPTTKDGYHGQCKTCVKLKAIESKPSKKKNKKAKIEYRKTKNLINPEHPIPIKKTTDDGFGGKWKYDSTRLNETIVKAFIATNGATHKNKHYPILQIKSQNKQQMIDFASYINMNPNGVIFIEREQGKENLQTYVINLYGYDYNHFGITHHVTY